VRILAHAASLDAHPRLARAAVGLALRGHRVLWSGAAPPAAPDLLLPDTLVEAPGGLAASRVEADLVIGGAESVRAVVVAGQLARVRGAVLGFEGGEPARWNGLDHLAWSSLQCSGLVDAAGAERITQGSGGVPLERFGLWPDGAPAAAPEAAHPDTEILERACERTLARQRGLHARSGVFVDRDGTLVVERGYLSDPADLELLPGVPQALQNLRAAGHPVVVLSNQSGVGRGLFTLGRVYEAMAMLRHLLRRHAVELDAIYFCPHRPEDGCRCRKPGTELIERAVDDLLLDIQSSAVVGDKLLDVQTAHHAGATGILVRTGYGREEEARALRGDETRPDFVAETLGDAVEWLLAREGLSSA